MTQFFTDNTDLMWAAFGILAFLAMVQTVRVAVEKDNANVWFKQTKELSSQCGDLVGEICDAQIRLADAEQIINALNGRVINIRDEKTQQFVSYHDIKKKILQYENKYYKKK